MVYGCTLGDEKVALYYANGDIQQINKRIGVLMKVLPPSLFARISKDMLVALDAILEVKNGKIRVHYADELLELPMGNTYVKPIYKWIEEYRLW